MLSNIIWSVWHYKFLFFMMENVLGGNSISMLKVGKHMQR